jgi:hypothetical protein
MLKTMARFRVILLVACLLGAGIYGIVQSNFTTLAAGNGFSGPVEQGVSSGNAQAFASSGAASDATIGQNFQDRDHDSEGESASGRAISGILRNMGVIALVTFGVVGAQKLITWVSGRRRSRTA